MGHLYIIWLVSLGKTDWVLSDVSLNKEFLIKFWKSSGSGLWIHLAGSRLFPRPAQPSMPVGLVNEDQLWLGRKRQIWFMPLVDDCGMCR